MHSNFRDVKMWRKKYILESMKYILAYSEIVIEI